MSVTCTRMGDGYVVELTPEQLRGDLKVGNADTYLETRREIRM